MLYSIECVQASIDEVYKTWETGKFPDKSTTNGVDLIEDWDGFAALQIAPIPRGHTIQSVSH